MADVYFAQSAVGAGNGTSCANAYAYNDGTHGINGSQTASWVAGNTLHLCGTITTAQNAPGVTVNGNGSSGSPITILFETSAILQSPAFGIRNQAGINFNNHSYITVNGGSNGQIQCTQNGTSGQTFCPAGACTIQQASNLIYLYCTNCIVENLQLGPNYVVLQNGDSNACTFSNDGCIFSDQNIFNVTVSNNNIHDAHWLTNWQIGGTGGNIQFFNNTLNNADHLMAFGIASGANINGLYLYNNIYGNLARWDNGSGCHHDSIHIYTQGANTSGTVTNLYIYNNQFDGPVGADPTSHIYLEPNGYVGTITSAWIFNNLMLYDAANSGECGNGCGNGLGFGAAGSTSLFIANNTLDGEGLGLCGGVGQPNVQGVTFGNNVVVNCVQLGGYGSGLPHFVASQPNHNTYGAATSSNIWNSCSTLSCWQSQTGAEANSTYTTSLSSILNTATYHLVSGSPGVSAAQNYYSTCNGGATPGIGPLCFDAPATVGYGSNSTVGNARPTSAAWDTGAYQFTSGGVSNVSLSPASNNFGTIAVGSNSNPFIFTLSNTGTASATITSITFTGTNPGDFSQSNTCGSSIAANTSCNISVTFFPAVNGTRTATLTITDSDASSPQTATLTGNGVFTDSFTGGSSFLLNLTSGWRITRY